MRDSVEPNLRLEAGIWGEHTKVCALIFQGQKVSGRLWTFLSVPARNRKGTLKGAKGQYACQARKPLAELKQRRHSKAVGREGERWGGWRPRPASTCSCYIRQTEWEMPIPARVGHLSLFSGSKGVLSVLYFPGYIKASGDNLIFQT